MSKHTTPYALAPCPCNQFELPLPAGVEDSELNSEQSAKITKIQLQFARDVANLIANAFAEVGQVLGDDCGKPNTGY